MTLSFRRLCLIFVAFSQMPYLTLAAENSPANGSFFTSLSPSLFDGQYHVKLTRKEMRIDHMAPHTRCTMSQRSCTLGLSFGQPVGSGLFSTRLDLPLYSAEQPTSPWNRASPGDYVLHLSDAPLRGPDLRLVASIHF